MARDELTVALVRDVFWERDGAARLSQRLAEARDVGAEIALLPELPLNPWSPASKQARDDDAEEPDGPRWRAQAQASAEAGIGLIGGAIVRDTDTGARRNTALVFDARGRLAATYCKLHIPEEPGFWETSHYEPGEDFARLIETFGFAFGVQICSDINRPEGSHLLGAMGALATLAPRATERIKYDRWLTVFRANAMTSATYVLSVDRPAPEQGVLLGGPSVAVAPDGATILESTAPIPTVTLKRAAVEQARRDYPGYLPVRAELYARAWSELAQGEV